MSKIIVGSIVLAAGVSLMATPGCIDVHHDDHHPPEEVRHVDVHEDVHHEDIHHDDVHHDDHPDYDRP